MPALFGKLQNSNSIQIKPMLPKRFASSLLMFSFALSVLLASGCAVVSATAGAAISVTGAVVSTGIKVTGKVVEAGIDAVTDDD